MRRGVNLLLIGIVAVGLGIGVYVLGRAILDTGHEYASLSSGETNSTATATSPTVSTDSGLSDRRRLQIRVGLITAGALVGVIALASAFGAASRSRRRERWRG